MTLCDINRI